MRRRRRPLLPARRVHQIIIDALRLIELSKRISALMVCSLLEGLVARDPLLSALRTLYSIPLYTRHVLGAIGRSSRGVSRQGARVRHDVTTDLIVIPWSTNTVVERLVSAPTLPNPLGAVGEANEVSIFIVCIRICSPRFCTFKRGCDAFRKAPNDEDVDYNNMGVTDGTHIFW